MCPVFTSVCESQLDIWALVDLLLTALLWQPSTDTVSARLKCFLGVLLFFFFLIKLTHQKHYEALELEALLQVLTQNTSFSTCGYRLILLHRHQGANPVFLLVGIYGQSGREACLDSLNVFMGHLKSWQELCRGKTFSLHHFLCVTAQQKTYSGALEFLPSLRVIKLRNIPG